MGLTELLAGTITEQIKMGGYISILILMIMESMVLPIPSEAVMPFAGFLVAENAFTFQNVVIFSTIGSIIGSLISYVIGYYGGKPVIRRFGKYVFLNEHHLEITEGYFKKYGGLTVFICRFIPIVRHLISIPAGVGKMNIVWFSLLTIVGAAMWNAFLTYVGLVLKNNWEVVMKYSKILDIIIIAGILGLVGYFIYLQLRKKKA